MATTATTTTLGGRRRNLRSLYQQVTDEEDFSTASSVEQKTVEKSCLRLYVLFAKNTNNKEQGRGDSPLLNKEATLSYLRKGLSSLSSGYECLDASRPWLVYWILHALELLGERITDVKMKSAVISFLSKCKNADGGFGGGPNQMSHLAPTYATVKALCILGGEEAYQIIDRVRLARWLNSLRLSDGSFLMHLDGEVDIRGTYCALSIARLLNIYSEDLFRSTFQWIMQCQTYEGGFGGVPGMEAHGGYSFCGLASLVLMNRDMLCNIESLMHWCVQRQMRLEGGFQGRTNKLVDGCYSFWQGGIFPSLHNALLKGRVIRKSVPRRRWLFHQEALQEYLLICCQDSRGGLIDKPGKARDFYHTCYTLSGLSVAQHSNGHSYIVGSPGNELVPTHPLFNVGIDSASEAMKYFERLGIPAVN